MPMPEIRASRRRIALQNLRSREACLMQWAAEQRRNAVDFQSVIDGGLLADALVQEWQRFVADARWADEELTKMVPDRDLVAAYQQTSGEEADADAEVLLAEIRRRNLDI